MLQASKTITEVEVSTITYVQVSVDITIDRVEKIINPIKDTTDIIVYLNDLLDMSYCPIDFAGMEGFGGENNNQSRLIVRYKHSNKEATEDVINEAYHQLENRASDNLMLNTFVSCGVSKPVLDCIVGYLSNTNKRLGNPGQKEWSVPLEHVFEMEYVGRLNDNSLPKRVLFSIAETKG